MRIRDSGPRRRDDPVPSPDDDLVGWRIRCLARAGFGAGLAHDLGRDARVDLHALLELVDRGCPPALAARIVSPLDRD